MQHEIYIFYFFFINHKFYYVVFYHSVLRATMKFQLRGLKPLSGIFDQQRVTRKFISSPQFSQLTSITSSADRDAIKMSACDHNIISNRQKVFFCEFDCLGTYFNYPSNKKKSFVIGPENSKIKFGRFLM